jgi:transposase-like protein
MASDFSNPIFHDADLAREWLERRLWADGPICPKCGVVDQATLLKGKSHRAGLYQCNACREPFTVTVGTIYERSHVPLNKWLGCTYLMMASKKGMSALQISRMIGVTYKTAWFMCHRVRESLRDGHPGELGGEGMTVEADETYVGGIVGTYHHVSAQHLKRYVGEFDFRYNERIALGVDDAERFSRAMSGIVGKRLTYRRIGGLEQGAQA